jgi:dTDP-4-amino-4,6-dideoxygalactose transaminase
MFESKSQNKVAYNIYSRGVNLPSFHDISKQDLEIVTGVLKILFRNP